MNNNRDNSKSGKELKNATAAKAAKVAQPVKGQNKTPFKPSIKDRTPDPKSTEKTRKSATPKTSKGDKPKTQDRRELAGRRLSKADAVMAYGEIFSFEDATRVAALDGKQASVSDMPDYSFTNGWQYYLVINTWHLLVADLHQADDPSGRAARTLIMLIKQVGLLATISLCCDAAQHLVQGGEVPERVRFLCTADMRDSLQCLRYAKRFTVLDANLLAERNRKSWLKVEGQVARFNVRNLSLNSIYTHLMRYLRTVLRHWLAGYKPVFCDDELPPIPSGATFERDKDGKSLSMSERARQYARRAYMRGRFMFNAADPDWDTPREEPRWDRPIVFAKNRRFATEGSKAIHADYFVNQKGGVTVLDPTTDKWIQPDNRFKYDEATNQWFLGRNPVRSRTSGGDLQTRRSCSLYVAACQHEVRYRIRKNRLIFVPKNYKTYRAVCPESPVNQMMQRKIRDHIWDCLPKWVRKRLPLRDQRVMETFAALSWNLGLTTTDLSHASDSFSVRVFVDAFPEAVRRDVMAWRPTHTVVEGLETPHRLEQLSSMGTGNVWLLMAIFLLACMEVACLLCQVPKQRRRACLVFGDDMIHPDEIRDTLYFILARMGFEVNVDKSYSDSAPYRESCGSEWWHEADGSVTSLRTLYYPRFPIAKCGKLCGLSWDYNVTADQAVPVDGLSRLIDLQHRLYTVSPSASEFIARAVKRLVPSMTTSIAGTPCDDLWGEVEEGPLREFPELFAPTDTDETVYNCGCYSVKFPRLTAKQRVPMMWSDAAQREVPAYTRVGHMRLTVSGTHEKYDPILSEWAYRDFLQHGPVCSVEGGWLPSNATISRTVQDPRSLTCKWKVVF